ncbi:lipase, partial [Xanthomonas euvesicatoria]
ITFTQRALKYAEQKHLSTGLPIPDVTVAGHSLGGNLAQVTAHHFGLKGQTFDAYGAVSLDRRIPEGGSDVINHVMAGD